MGSNGIKVIKILSVIASVVGMLGSAWASSEENKVVLANLVEKHFQNQ